MPNKQIWRIIKVRVVHRISYTKLKNQLLQNTRTKVFSTNIFVSKTKIWIPDSGNHGGQLNFSTRMILGEKILTLVSIVIYAECACF